MENVRLILADIIRGYTHVEESEFGPFFIKHLNNFDIADIDSVYSLYFEKAKSKNILTNKEKIEFLIKNDIWSKKEEDKLKDYKKTLDQYDLNKSNEFVKSKRDIWKDEIEKLQKDINKLEIKRANLMGDTAESFASKKANEEHIILSFYKDKEFKRNLFSRQEFNEFDNKIISKIIELLKINTEKFNPRNLIKISLSPSYLNMFNLSSESIYEFYGKPVIQLSFYQMDVWGSARRFQQDLSQFPNIPKDIQSDPDKLIEYIELNKNYKKAFPDKDNEEGGGGVSIVGANKEDLEILGMTPDNTFNFDKELKKAGGKLGMEKILTLQGEM